MRTNYKQLYDNVCLEGRKLSEINKELLEACKMAIPWIGKMITNEFYEKCVNLQNALKTLANLEQAITKSEGK